MYGAPAVANGMIVVSPQDGDGYALDTRTGQRRDFHHKTALALLRQYDTIHLEELQVRNMVRTPISPRVSVMPAGRRSVPSSRAQQYTLASGLSRCRLCSPARTVGACCPMAAAVCSG
jgi:hypothetical protein